MDETAPVNKMT